MTSTRHADHVLTELGFGIARDGDELHGRADVVPEMWAPGTTSLRTSILAAWADHICGLLVATEIAPRVPVTLELEVHVHRELAGIDTVHAVGRTLKHGRSVAVVAVDFSTADGEPVAIATASFMPAPDAGLTMPTVVESLLLARHRRPTLKVPFAERARCERRDRGVAVLQGGNDSRNASNTLNGGLIALVIEEAALSATPDATLSSLALRYLRPVRVGPAVATADVRGGLGRVEVRDAGSDDRLAVMATTRTFGA